MTFSLQVQLNYELEREILGFGDRVRVLSPERLKRRIKECVTHALDQYQYELSENALHGAIQKLTYKGFMILHHVFSKKEINQIKSRIDYYFRIRKEENVSRLHEGLVDQQCEEVEHLVRLHVVGATHIDRSVERASAREQRHPAEHGTLDVGQQLVAPVDGCRKRLLARHGGARAARQQVEPAVESVEDLAGREDADPRRRQLDRQGSAVQTTADLSDRLGVRGRRGEIGARS